MATTQTDRLSSASTLGMKAPCRVCSSTNITLYGEQVIDGVSVADGERVLVNGQTNPVENGIYICRETSWERARDFNGAYDAVKGSMVKVNDGANAGFYVLSSNLSIGTDSVSFSQIAFGVDLPTAGEVPAVLGARLAGEFGWIKQGFVNVLTFGAVGDGVTDNKTAFDAAIAYCNAAKRNLYIPSGTYLISGGSYELTDGVQIIGDGRDFSIISLTGTPPKTVFTRRVWRSEYDTGDYTYNSDSAYSYGFLLNSQRCGLHGVTVKTHFTAADITFTTPFNALTQYPTSGYDYGIVVVKAECTLRDVMCFGFFTASALLLDSSNVGGFGDGFLADNCSFSGTWGVIIFGPRGQGISGDDYAEMAFDDTRGAAGMSDIRFRGCEINDLCGVSKLTIDGVQKYVRRGTAYGALFISGQCSRNLAKRIQGITFDGRCRIASASGSIFKINYAHRVNLADVHWEWFSGAVGTDGVTAVTSSDCAYVVTKNARNVLFGACDAGGTDARVRTDGGEVCYQDNQLHRILDGGSTFSDIKRHFSTDWLSRQGSFVPTIVATTPGAPTYASQQGHYVRIGQVVFFWLTVALSSKGGMGGEVTVEGLPFESSDDITTSFAVNVGITSGVTSGTAGFSAIVDNSTTAVIPLKLNSGSAHARISSSDLTDTARIDLSGCYTTDAA